MGTLDLLKVYFTPRKKGTLGLGQLENMLRSQYTRRHQSRTLLWSAMAIFALALGYFVFQRGMPMAQEHLPRALEGLPIEAQILASGGLIMALAGGVCHTVFRLFRRSAERRRVEVDLQNSNTSRKMMVYVYGSGAKGFCDAIERLGRSASFKNLVIFAQPPLDIVKKGYLRIKGAITACMPVQSAKGTYMAAAAARATEARYCDAGHAAFLESVGAEGTTVEWSMMHLGEGHTSISCHTAWEEKRTTMNHGALPGRFFVVIRDSDGLDALVKDEPDCEETVDIYDGQDDTKDVSNMAPRALVRVSGGGKVGSGVVIGRDGMILTAAHVVNDLPTVDVRIGEKDYMAADVIYRNQDADVAFIKVHQSESLIPIVYGNSDALESGDQVVAYGYPADSGYEGMPVAALGSIVDSSAEGPYTVIHTDAMVGPGCSGGPLTTLDGRFVGMVTSRSPGRGTNGEVTSALSSEDVKDVLDVYYSTKSIPVAGPANGQVPGTDTSENYEGGITN